jgi:collagen type VII alpha
MPLTKITTDNIDFSSNLVFSNVYSMEVTSHFAVNGTIVANTGGTYATHLGGVGHSNFVQNTDSRTLSGNLSFTGTNVSFSSNTAVTLPVGTTAQRPSGSAGMLRYNANTGKFEGFTSTWGNIGGGAAYSDTPPANPGGGDLWWNTSDGRMYIYYPDANTSQWVDTSAAGAGQYLSLGGGTVSGAVNVAGNVVVSGTLATTSNITASGYIIGTTSNSVNFGVRVQTPTGSASPAILQFTNNPVTAQWAAIASTAQNVLEIRDGGNIARLSMNGSGHILMPSQPGFKSGTSTFDGTSGLATNWQTTNSNVGGLSYRYRNSGNFNTTTGRFTVPVTGKYLIVATYADDDAVVQRHIGWLWINGTNIGEWVESYGQYDNTTGVFIEYLNANDYVEFARHPGIPYSQLVASIDFLG